MLYCIVRLRKRSDPSLGCGHKRFRFLRLLLSFRPGRAARIAAGRAASVLLAERFGLHKLAAQADRTLRTFTARRVATETYAMVQASQSLDPVRLLTGLERRATWSRVGDHEFACSFGPRRATLALRQGTNVEELARMITRIEVRVLLGDLEYAVVAQLQSLADSELQRLLA